MGLTRERFISVGLFSIAGGVCFQSCSRTNQTALPILRPTEVDALEVNYVLTRETNGTLTDKRLVIYPHPYLQALTFSLDLQRLQGSLVMEAILREASELRIISNETDSKDPGLIYCASSLEQPGEIRKYPVIRFAPNEQYLISLGFKREGEDCIKSYQDMMTYFVKRDSNGSLEASFSGLGTYHPDDPEFKPHDREAAQPAYFRVSCLS
ncbi:MAG: hypothetical protein M1607_01895 [Patescibacteria group bacterium]|nr:hypothetical protein [Patescibacteria group bacterium]